MSKFLGSKTFVLVSTLLTLVIGGIVGRLMGYEPIVAGYVSTHTKYVFQIRLACGYWLLALIITFVVLLLSITIRNQYTNRIDKTEIEK
ncbi:MAG: hypothetical protein K2J01_04520 [Clostridiales bacterium]|nr:hypothetical protein [Clostridiales bacterium]